MKQLLENRLQSEGEQWLDSQAFGISKQLQENRKEFRKCSVSAECGPTRKKHYLMPLFEKNNLKLKKYGNIERRRMTREECIQIGMDKDYLVNVIEGDKKRRTKDKFIYPRNIVFKYSNSTYTVRWEFYVKSKFV